MSEIKDSDSSLDKTLNTKDDYECEETSPDSNKSKTLLDRIKHHNKFSLDSRVRTLKKEVTIEENLSGRNNIPGKYEIGIATLPEEFEEIFKLRFKSYTEAGFLFSKSNEELEYEEHDQNAALFYARNLETEKLHCAARLVFSQYDGRLPMDSHINMKQFLEEINFQAGMTLVEFSRLVSLPTGQKQLNKTIVRFVLEFAVAPEQKVNYLLGLGRVDIKQFYEKWGFRELEPYTEVEIKYADYAPKKMFYPHYMEPKDIKWDKI